MRYYEYMREEGRRMDRKAMFEIGDTVTPKSDNADDAWVGVVENIYEHASDLWVDVAYQDGFDVVEDTLLYDDLEIFYHNDYSSEEDNVNHPSHYGTGKIECIEYLEDFLTHEEFIGYLRGNIGKYLHRWRYKNGLEDLEKAQWYLNKLIERVRANGC